MILVATKCRQCSETAVSGPTDGPKASRAGRVAPIGRYQPANRHVCELPEIAQPDNQVELGQDELKIILVWGLRHPQESWAYWERARNGDIKAAEFVLKIISLRVRMLGLDREAARNDTGPVLIVDGTEEEFVAKMRAVVEHDVEAMEEFWPGSANHVDRGFRPPVGRSPQPTHGDLADAREIGYTNLVI